ncbi:MAG: FAD/NAD(P)-binding protein [Deltaproteobacteria bacterium]|nr:FAD/NAD(P)-binding protein [Deltaproteobacteria bacterium]
MSAGLLVPRLARVKDVRRLTPDTLLFEVAADGFAHRPGQFAALGVLGVGECPISICSSPTRPGPLQFAIREVGLVTRALHELEPGDEIGLRGPLGNSFPVEDMAGKGIVFIAGGIGLAPLRSLIDYVLDRRPDYGTVDIFYGARAPGLLLFADELDAWRAAPATRAHLTVDAPAPGWAGRVGFVPALVAQLALAPQGRVAVTCGPPVMIKLVLAQLAAAGWRPEQVVTTLELKMKCGVGKCGRCNIGPKYVCTDGPVFRLSELAELPQEY